MIQYNFEQVKNKHNGKIAFVCGIGPSLSDTINHIIKERENIILVSCSDIDLISNLHPDYWVWANTKQVGGLIDRLKGMPNASLVHADSVDLTPRLWIEENLENLNYIGYDQRHFNNQKCNNCPNGCDNFIEGRLTIQEELQKFTDNDEKYSSGDTVAVHMLALSILLGCKEIYITGVDLDYRKGYYSSYMSPHSAVEFDIYIDNILNDFRIIRDSAKNIGVEIYNTSNTSPLKTIFENINNL